MNSVKILVVDDILDFRILVRSLLSKEGHTVLEATNGQEALVMLGRDEDIKLVLLDVQLPGPDGFSIMEDINLIRQNRPYLRVAFLTGKRDRSDIIKGLKLHADGYIIKPLDPAIFKAKIAALLADAAHPRKYDLPKIENAVACLFEATLDDVPLQFKVSIRALAAEAASLESRLPFIPGMEFKLRSESLAKALNIGHAVFAARVVSSDELSPEQHRVRIYFIGNPPSVDEHLRTYVSQNHEAFPTTDF